MSDLAATTTPGGTIAGWLASKRVVPYVFMSPVMLFGLLFFVLPLGFAAFVSLTDWDSMSPPRWVGADNYVYLLTRDPFLLSSLVATFTFAAGMMALGVPLALTIAYLVSRSRYVAFWRSVFWLPMITNLVAVAYIWKFILADTSGVLNQLLDVLGLPGPNWLTSPSLAIVSVILVAVWVSLGHNILLFLTGLNEIDESYYEAASIDGAEPFDLFRHITIPLLKPTIVFVMITNFITALSSFALMLVLTEGGPARSTTVTGLYLYEMAFGDLRLGRASAAAYILFALILGISLVQLRLFRRGGVAAR